MRWQGGDNKHMEKERNWCVYILLCSDGTLYTGMTDHMDRRLKTHNTGKGAKYTRGRGPVTLVYREDCDGRSEALKREHAIKQLSREKKLDLIKLSVDDIVLKQKS